MSLILAIVALISFIGSSNANYSTNARTNLAMYWGQGPNQQRLLHFCQQSTVDIIPIGFVNVFPAQGNGYPGTNFGNQCWGGSYVYKGPGTDHSKDQLQSECPNINADIPVCQSTYGKKIILSLGGGSATYQLTGASDGLAFADFLWGAFGPQTTAWVLAGKPRPFDGPNGEAVSVDGFDFDIEIKSTDNQAGYIAMIQRLRIHMSSASKPYLITGTPQCVVPDANMGNMISKVQFDILFIQYYNTAQCSGRNWVSANPNYPSIAEQSSGFTYNAWASALVGTSSAKAKLYIGVPGSTTAAAASYYLTPTELSKLIQAYFCKANFGGIMIWEATYAENNAVSGGTYYQAVKKLLTGFSTNTALSCVPKPPSTSIRTSSTSKVTMTTSPKVSSTTKPVSTSAKSNTLVTSTVKTSSSSAKITSTSSKSSSSGKVASSAK